jgi:hypothetical protein
MSVTERLSEKNYVINEPGIFYIGDEEVKDDDERLIPSEQEYGDMPQTPKLDIDDIETYYDKYK